MQCRANLDVALLELTPKCGMIEHWTLVAIMQIIFLLADKAKPLHVTILCRVSMGSNSCRATDEKYCKSYTF